MKVLLLSIFICINLFCHAQESALLFNKLKVAKTDTQKINILNALTKIYLDFNLDSASLLNQQSISIASNKKNEKYSYKGIYYKAVINRKNKNLDSALIIANKALAIAKTNNNLSEQANAYNLTGTIYDQLNKNDLAFENFQKALKLSTLIKDKKELLSSNLHLGIYYKKINKTTDALSNLLEAMKISEEIKDSTVIFTTSINLGSMYERTKDLPKAMECYKKALYIAKTDKDKDENDLAICYFKIGKLFQNLKIVDSAKYYLNETLKIHLRRNDEEGLIFDYSNLAHYSTEVGDFNNAEKNFRKALELGLKTKDSIRLNLLYSYLGAMFREKKDYDNALKNYKIALSYATKMVSTETIMMEYKKLAEIYSETGKYKDAFENYVKFKSWSDSSYNVNDTKKQTELKLNYDFEKIQKKIEDENKAKEILNQIELEKKRLQRNYLLAGFLIISILLIVAIKSYITSRRANVILHTQKKEIEHQKKLVDEKNLEISDSINYALRIQTASIPKMSELDTYFKDYDLFFKPKDIVSGDFYWAAKMGEYSLIAIGDCTGHGVPGAITSMIGSMLLNEIFYVKKIFQPNEVLTELNRLVKLTLRQESDTLSNDGMDIAFCLINNKTNEIHYSGANRPLYVTNSEHGLTEYKATKTSVGGQVPLIQQYDLHKIQLQVGDTVVMSTDGYVDQFGGGKEKKFTSKAFRNLLVGNHHLSANEQKQIIETNHSNWKGNFEQTDDILVFIIKV